MLDRQRLVATFIIWCGLMAGMGLMGGCKKSAPGSGSQAATTPLAFGGNDVNPDGTLSQKTLDTLESKSSEPALAISFIRTPLSNAGLAQMAKFKNIRRIDAIGSKITADGVDQLKQAIPEVEVGH